MDPANRSRSPSVNRANQHSHLNPPHSSSQADLLLAQTASLGLLNQPVNLADTSFVNHYANTSNQNLFDASFDFGQPTHPLENQSHLATPPLSDQHPLAQPNILGNQFTQDSSLFSDLNSLGDNSAALNGFDQNLFPTNSDLAKFLDASPALDPRVLDPQSQLQSQVNPSNTNFMASITSHPHAPTPPHLLSPAMQRQASASPHGSPGMLQGPFQPPSSNHHSRNASLDPSSAQYPPMQNWNTNESFRHHRRLSSGAHSDVSSSAHPSPYLGHHDSYEGSNSHSPLLNAIPDPQLYNAVMPQMGQFSISEGHHQQNAFVTPGHSPHISPALLPVQSQLPSFSTSDSFGLTNGGATSLNTFNGNSGLGMFPNHVQESFPAFANQPIGHDSPGQADTMSPPEFKFDFAPPSRQPSFDPPKVEVSTEGLTPPTNRGRRMRAVSDPFTGGSSRQSTPARDTGSNTLAPVAAGVGSRSPSPSGKNRRSSTSNVPNRDYILDLADPNRPASTASEGGSGSKRMQKHPATFQCTLCPKRFTRAYNLRSHLRTHTDERPFVCSVCGKAFARQHDRKRHEGLHSGEKKFVCRGTLKNGSHWGCGRRFARADALGRHFRSEAGRVCIKSLMDEESLEHQQMQHRSQMGAADGLGMPMMTGPGMTPGMVMPATTFDAYGNPISSGFDYNMGGAYRLPAALLAQYPTLQGIWDTLPINPPDEVDGLSGGSAFEASSAGEYEEGDEYNGDPGNYGWASDVGP